jgi:hypothetical protein
VLHNRDDFRDLLVTVGETTGAGAAIVEKDYWVTEALRAVAEHYDSAVVFKGGTSLSKAHRLISRFSEDIDLLVRSEVGGRARRDTLMKEIEGAVESIDGLELIGGGRSERGISRTSVLQYRPVVESVVGLNPTVLLEMGIRGGPNPTTKVALCSMLDDELAKSENPDLASASFELTVLGPVRTFVEKLFAIHSACVLWREGRQNALARQSRHLADLHALAGADPVKAFVGTDEYRNLVREVSAIGAEWFPRDHRPPHELSFASSPALAPDKALRHALEADYEQSRFLFYGDRPELSAVFSRLGELRPSL